MARDQHNKAQGMTREGFEKLNDTTSSDAGLDDLGSLACRKVLGPMTTLVFEFQPCSVDFRAPLGFDLVVGHRNGVISLCVHDSPDRRIELGPVGRGDIRSAFCASENTLIGCSVQGELQIFRKDDFGDWNRVFQNDSNSRVVSCFPLDSNSLIIVMRDGCVGVVELGASRDPELKRFLFGEHHISQLLSLDGSRAVAVTSKGNLIAVDDITLPKKIEFLPTSYTYPYSFLQKLSSASFVVCRASGGIENWCLSEQHGWISSQLDFRGVPTQLLAATKDLLIVRSEDSLVVAERQGDEWVQTSLQPGTSATSGALISSAAFVVGEFRGGVVLWTRCHKGPWKSQELVPHSGMVNVASNSTNIGLITGSYDYSLRSWGRFQAEGDAK